MSDAVSISSAENFPSDTRTALLALARQAVLAAVGGAPRPVVEAVWAASLPERGGVFVSLYRHGRLRGCVGRIRALGNLAEAVCECAVAAAMDDPRFSPLTLTECDGLSLEISALSASSVARAEDVQPGTHGLAVERGYYRGVLLPQVATRYNWTRERFLEETCLKAGLPADAWKDPQTRIEVFTAEVFGEAEHA